MQLARALRLAPVPRLAFVGAGGKTAALFHLANELKKPSRQAGVSREAISTVLVTTTTHMSVEQLMRADHHFIIKAPQDIARWVTDLPAGSVLLTGPATADERVSGLQPETLEQLYLMAEANQLPLLVEADGARRLPLKAPAEHEPDIPAWVESVVVVAGVSALGRPLSPEWVHRPERFSALAGLAPGEAITPAALGRVLTSPNGGLKGIPPAARRIALLNQADTSELKSLASRMSSALLSPGCYEAVLITTLQPPIQQGVENETVWAVHEPVSGIILAAGGSQRLGKPKQLLEWRGQPLVRHVARTALESGLSPVVLVSGAYAPEVERAVADLALTIAPNPAWMEGQSTSLAAGLQALPNPMGGAVFLLSDQPQIPATLVRSLVELHARTLSPLVAPEIDGRRANPVLFDRQTFPALLALQGDTGGRPLFSHFPVAWLPWHDPSLLIDVDTEEDYARLQQL